MAIVTYSAVVSDARRKIGGVVFSKGHANPLVRRKVSPAQPRTQAQSGVRSNFTMFAKDWSAVLTAAQRAAWTALAAQVTRKNKLGQSHTLTGLQLFQSLNRNLSTISVTEITDPPASLVVEAPGVVTAAYTKPTPGPEAFTVTPTTYPTAACDAVIFAAPPLSVGKTYIGARYRFIMFAVGGTSAPYSILVAYKAKFGTIPAGKQLPVKLVYINNTSGAKGTPVTTSASS
jgi:hypothetical protein